jgi:hypothetical protein
MGMDVSAFKAGLKSDFTLIFDVCNAGSGMSPSDYADMLAEAIASRTVEHITGNAEVIGTAGPYPVTGKVL